MNPESSEDPLDRAKSGIRADADRARERAPLPERKIAVPVRRADSAGRVAITELARHAGPTFVDQAYRAILKRGPDPAGFERQMAALAAGTNEAPAVIRKMKEKPIEDALFGPVRVRADGRAVHNMYIFKVKDPKSSTSKWDVLEKIGVLSGEEAFRPLEQGGCALIEQPKAD